MLCVLCCQVGLRSLIPAPTDHYLHSLLTLAGWFTAEQGLKPFILVGWFTAGQSLEPLPRLADRLSLCFAFHPAQILVLFLLLSLSDSLEETPHGLELYHCWRVSRVNGALLGPQVTKLDEASSCS
jgi:hypothetical protein